MSEGDRRLTLPDGATLVVPAALDAAVDHVLDAWCRSCSDGARDASDLADRLVVTLRGAGLAVVPLGFARSTQTVDMNIYTQALAWKHDAERRAAAAERELAELQRLFTNPPHAARREGP